MRMQLKRLKLADKMRKICSCLIAFSLVFSFANRPAMSCASWSYEAFYWTHHPDDATGPFLKGRLGVILPSFDTFYQVVAYRYLSKNALSESEIEAARAMIEQHDKREDIGCAEADQSEWIAARKRALGDSGQTDKDVSIETQANTLGAVPIAVCNIQSDAFVTAAKTLNSLVTKYGAKSAAVTDWVAAQDQVFSNNDPSKPSIPSPLSGADKLLQQHRSYQIAAAHFYAMQWTDAIKDFTSIGEDTSSPWCALSKYLAVRSLIREATLTADPFDKKTMEEAAQRLESLCGDKLVSALREDLFDLQDFIATKLDENSSQYAKKREHHLADSVLHKLTTRALLEYANTFDRINGSSVSASHKPALGSTEQYSDLTDWIRSFTAATTDGKAHAISRWKSTKNNAWLVVALNEVDLEDTECGALIAEAGKVPASDPAYVTLNYEAARILTAKKNYGQARRLVDSALAQKDLCQSSHNLFLELRLRLARSVDEFARDSMTMSVGTSGDYEEPNDGATARKSSLMELACEIYDDNFPLTVLKAAVASASYPQDQRIKLGRVTFVRAVLLDNEAIATFAADQLSKMKAKDAALYKSYTVAPTAQERKFIAAYIMLRNDDSSPAFNRNFEYWWSSKVSDQSNVLDGDEFPGWNSPPFLTAADRARAERERAALDKIPAAPTYLPTVAISWAKSHPADPRVPEALHYAVSTTRYGERNEASAKLSKEAFLLLHKQHAKNHWTDETPYWYGAI